MRRPIVTRKPSVLDLIASWLRPREGHDVRIEQIRVEIEPEFELPLQRCGEGERMDQHDNRPARRL
jgi:hypothetical protein